MTLSDRSLRSWNIIPLPVYYEKLKQFISISFLKTFVLLFVCILLLHVMYVPQIIIIFLFRSRLSFRGSYKTRKNVLPLPMCLYLWFPSSLGSSRFPASIILLIPEGLQRFAYSKSTDNEFSQLPYCLTKFLFHLHFWKISSLEIEL